MWICIIFFSLNGLFDPGYPGEPGCMKTATVVVSNLFIPFLRYEVCKILENDLIGKAPKPHSFDVNRMMFPCIKARPDVLPSYLQAWLQNHKLILIPQGLQNTWIKSKEKKWCWLPDTIVIARWVTVEYNSMYIFKIWSMIILVVNDETCSYDFWIKFKIRHYCIARWVTVEYSSSVLLKLD